VTTDTTTTARREGRSSAWALIGTAVGAAANFALLIVVTAAYGQTLFGIFAAVTALFQLGAVLFRLGAEVGSTYAIARLRATGRGADARTVLVAALAPVVVVSVAVAAVVMATAPDLAAALTKDAADRADYTDMLRILALALPVATVGEVLLGATRGFASMRPTVIASNFGRQFGQLVTVGAVAMVSDGATELAVAWAAPYLVTVAYPAVWLTFVLRDLGATSAAPPWGSFWRYTSPQAANAAVQGGLEKADIILLGRLSGAESTAVYSLANRFVHVVVLARYALNVSQAAAFAEGFEAKAHDRVNDLAVKVATWTALVCGPVLWLLAVFPGAALTVVGAEYDGGATALTVLAVAMVVALWLGPVEGLLLMSGASMLALVNNGVALVVNLGLNLWLIPEYGATGAAVAWAISLLLGRMLSLIPLRRRFGVVSQGAPLVLAFATAALAFGGIGVLVRLVLGDSLVALVATAVLGGVALVAVTVRSSAALRVDELVAGLRPA